MKLSLYQIQNEHIQIVEQLINNEGELTDELEVAMTINKEQLETKGTCYAFIVKELEGENDLIDIEIKRLTGLKSTRNKTIDKLKTNLSTAMQVFEVEEIKTPLIKINFRKSESVEVLDMALLDEKFKKISEPVTSADKTKIKEAIKGGENVTGAVINYNKNIQIK